MVVWKTTKRSVEHDTVDEERYFWNRNDAEDGLCESIGDTIADQHWEDFDWNELKTLGLDSYFDRKHEQIRDEYDTDLNVMLKLAKALLHYDWRFELEPLEIEGSKKKTKKRQRPEEREGTVVIRTNIESWHRCQHPKWSIVHCHHDAYKSSEKEVKLRCTECTNELNMTI